MTTHSTTAAPRIALATDAYMPWSGGSRVYYHNLYSRLAALHGYDVTVLTTHTAGDAAFDAATTTARLHIRRHGTPLPDWKIKRLPACAAYAARLARDVTRLRPHALHCGDLAPQALAAYLLHRLTGRPYLVFVHGDEISQTDNRRHQPKLRNAIYRNAHTLIAANPFAFAHLERILGSARRCHLLLPGVDFTHFFETDEPSPWRATLLAGQPGPLIFTAARLVPRKGHARLLRALVRVVAEFPSLRYAIAGDGPELGRLEELTLSLGLTQHVHFLGNVPHAELGELYRAADIFVLPNQADPGGDIESFGMVFIEANACGRPVIGGTAGGTSAAVVDGVTGLLCDASREEELAAALLILLRYPDRARAMGQAGAIRARADFQWTDRAATLHAITQEMLATAETASGDPRAVSRSV